LDAQPTALIFTREDGGPEEVAERDFVLHQAESWVDGEIGLGEGGRGEME